MIDAGHTKVHRILVVDDHAIIRRGLALMIVQEPGLRVMGEAEDLASAIERLDKEPFDLAIVDLSLTGPSGLEVIRHIASRYPAMRVVVLTMQDESIWLERAMTAGAHAFVTKDTATDKLVGAIRHVLGGAVYLSERAQARLVQSLQGVRKPVPVGGVELLTNREIEVLQLMAQGLGSAEIAQSLSRSVKTIESHKENLKVKLKLTSASALMRFAVRWESSR